MKDLKTSAKAVAGLVADLPEEELLLLADTNLRPRLRRWLGRAHRQQTANMFVTPLSDEAAVGFYMGRRKLADDAAKAIVSSWRRLAAELGYSGPIAWQVREGFTLKGHGPKSGSTYQNWAYLQDWPLQNDEPTRESIVLWIPRLLTGSTAKNVGQQKVLLGDFRTRFVLPGHHLTTFGSAALLTALIHAHTKRTGERTPLNGYWTRTDTLRVVGRRLDLSWGGGGLHCDGWSDSGRSGDLGVFPLGVEALGS
ncbi:MAG: hypothetical protein HY461_00960 [Parcubacteria group bacterium]|nr:hypothetical protein [Parcubacteria group bacterium]